MTSQSNSVLTSSPRSFSRVSSLIVIVIGCLVLVGWAFDIMTLKSVLPGLATMKANSALAFVLAGTSLWLLQSEQADQRRRRIAQVCAFIVVLLGLLTLSEYLFRWDLGIDQLLLQDMQTDPATSQPRRMASATALNFLLLGAALLFLDVETRRGHYPGQWLTLGAAFVSVIALVGYAYGVQTLYRVGAYSSVALHTAAGFLLLSIGILCARPDRGLMAIISSSGVGGLTARRLLPTTVFILLVLGWLRLLGQHAGFYDTEFGLALMLAFGMAALAIVIWRTAQLLDQIEQERRQEEAKFRTLVESAPDAILSIDGNGIIKHVNDQTEKIFGYSKDELINRPVETLVPERFRELHVGHRAKYSSEPRARPMGTGFDLYGRRKDGSEVPVDISLSPLQTDREVLATIIVRDVSDRKRAEQALQARYEELYALHEIGQTILTSADVESIVKGILDKAFSICYFDIGVIRLLDPSGRKLRPVISQGYQNPENIREISTDAADATAGGIQGKVLASKNAIVLESIAGSPGMRSFKKEGVQSAVVVPIQAEEQILGTIQLGSRTPRKFQPHEVRLLETIGGQLGVAVQKSQLYEETRQNLERIRVLREIDQAITSTLNLDAILSLLLEKIDPFLAYPFASTVMLHNRETKELQPAACRHLDETEWRRHVSDPAHGRGNQWIVLETKAPLKVLNVQTDPQTRHPGFVRKHGLVSFLGVPLIAKGDDLGVLSIYAKEEHDFSDEEVELVSTLAGQAAIAIHNAQLYEEMSKLAGDLSKSNRVKDEFLSVMSHELRTPLNVVMGYAGMIKDGLLGEITHQQKEGLEKIINRGNDQLFMINNVLYATTLETEEVKIEAHEISLVDFLNQLRLGREAPTHKELTLHWDCPPDLPVIKTDSAKLKQILQNLIDNAIKFTDKGTVTISARFLPVSDSPVPRIGEGVNRGRSVVEFRVTDTGVGIPKEALAIIFEKFRQLDSSETRLYGGVGMGLYIVKKLAELLGGTVNVESESGKGSTFTVTIPLERRASMSE